MSTDRHIDSVLASAMAALVADELDITDVLAHSMTDGTEVVGVKAAALMVQDNLDELSMLAASSHSATEIELLQIQRLPGPCVDCIRTGEGGSLAGADRLVQRWDEVGPRIVDAGFASVEAYPMRWRGETLGGLNLFRAHSATTGAPALCQTLANIAALVVMQSAAVAAPISHEQIRARIHEALNARQLFEQAREVLAHVQHLDMEQASSAYACTVTTARAARSASTPSPATPSPRRPSSSPICSPHTRACCSGTPAGSRPEHRPGEPQGHRAGARPAHAATRHRRGRRCRLPGPLSASSETKLRDVAASVLHEHRVRVHSRSDTQIDPEPV